MLDVNEWSARMRRLYQSLFVTALAAAGVWIYALTGAALQLHTLFGSVAQIAHDGAPTTFPRVPAQPADAMSSSATPRAAHETPNGGRLPPPTGDLSAMQIMRLLEDELATETDAAAADEVLRTFEQSVDQQEEGHE
jgi:hypothetical protein